MCSIAGVITTDRIQPKYLSAMAAPLRHRGPDGYGYLLYSPAAGIHTWLNQNIPRFSSDPYQIGFAHQRLAILDLSNAGLQPMLDETKKYAIVFNGEIYNYLVLKKQLKALGYTFNTSSDTEVLLKAYIAWGEKCLKQLNGMWAFAILDTQRQQVIFSRDRFGIKPLYYTFHNSNLYFASEIKGLLAIPSIKPQPNEKTVASYLLSGLLDHTSETFFKNVYQFPAGHWAKISLNNKNINLKPQVYWSFPKHKFKGSQQEASAQFKKLFFNAVKNHCQSDVPVGTCLSGGLDSSSIVCVASSLRRNHQIPKYSHHAFGYVCPDKKYSEKKYMNIIARKTSTKMHCINFSYQQFQKALPNIIKSQDEPFGSASIAAQWFIFKHVKKKGLKVMLDGQGADETLAGYHKYYSRLGWLFINRNQLLKLLKFKAEFEREIGPFPISNLELIEYLTPQWLRQLTRPITSRILPLPAINITSKLFQSTIKNRLKKLESRRPINRHKRFSSLTTSLKKDVTSFILPALLRYEDRNSMSHSIESRLPFLDYPLVKFIFTLPDEYKICDTQTKYILREVMKSILPNQIRTRKDKIGFKCTPKVTFDYAQKKYSSLVENKLDYETHWFKAEEIAKFIKKNDHSPTAEFLLWRIINTKLWARHFFR